MKQKEKKKLKEMSWKKRIQQFKKHNYDIRYCISHLPFIKGNTAKVFHILEKTKWTDGHPKGNPYHYDVCEAIKEQDSFGFAKKNDTQILGILEQLEFDSQISAKAIKYLRQVPNIKIVLRETKNDPDVRKAAPLKYRKRLSTVS